MSTVSFLAQLDSGILSFNFLQCFILSGFCASFSCNSMLHSGCSALRGVNPN